jgi:hypothetical protein
MHYPDYRPDRVDRTVIPHPEGDVIVSTVLLSRSYWSDLASPRFETLVFGLGLSWECACREDSITQHANAVRWMTELLAIGRPCAWCGKHCDGSCD